MRFKDFLLWILILIIAGLIVNFILNPTFLSKVFLFGTNDFRAYVENPEDHLGENFTAKGEYATNFFGVHFLKDRKDYPIRFKPSVYREFELGKIYSITGTFKKETEFACDNQESQNGGITSVTGSCYDKVLYYYLEEN